MVTLREELLSHAPSAHLETIVVAPAARGRGIGRSLLARAEDRAQQLGAQSLTLHVFSNNHRARRLYQRGGYEESSYGALNGWIELTESLLSECVATDLERDQLG